MNTIHRLACVLVLAFATQGCAHHEPPSETLVFTPQSESAETGYQRVFAANERARHDLQACGDAVYDDARFASISAHIPFNPDLSSLAQLDDGHYATKKEIALLFVFDTAFAKCPAALVERMRIIAPGMAMIIADGYAKNEYITADLIEGKLTWGEYATKRATNYDEAVHNLGFELLHIRRGTNPDYAADPTARQSVLAAVTQFYRSLQLVPSLRAGRIKPSS